MRPSTSARETPARQADRLRRPSDMERAIDRYARAYDTAARNHHEGLPVLEAHSRELQRARQQLDQARSGATALMVPALQRDQETRQAMRELSGFLTREGDKALFDDLLQARPKGEPDAS